MAAQYPNTLAELDRDSAEHARLLIEQKLLPDPVTRQPLLEALADTIEACGTKPASWSVTLAPWVLVVNAGWAFVLKITPTKTEVAFDEAALTDEDREWMEEQGVGEPSEPYGTGVRFFGISTAAAGQAGERLSRLARSAVAKEYTAKEGRITWWESNSPGVIAYLESALDRKFPYPDFTQARDMVRCWKIAPGSQAWQWDECREGGFIGIGWPKLGDLRRFESREDFERAREAIEQEDETYTKVGSSQVWLFRHIKKGDRIVANRGTREILGVGTVVGEYDFVPEDTEHPHRLAVRWDRTEPIAVEQPGWRRSLIELGKATFQKLLKDPEDEDKEKPEVKEPSDAFAAIADSLRGNGYYFPDELLASFLLALQAKRFVILCGISGTGKTKLALEVARHFSGTRTETVAVDVPDTAVEMTVSPYMTRHRRFVIPAELLTTLELPELGERNSAEVAVAYPGGVEALRLWKSPDRGVAVLGLSGGVGKWFRAAVSAGDTFILDAPQEEEGPYFRLELPEKREKVVTVEAVEVVAVRPDWTDNRSLLGFYNPLTEQYVTTPFLDLLMRAAEEAGRARRENRDPLPFFAILDEMNLARVEQYFSDFLSALESGEPMHLHDSPEVEEGRASGRTVPRRLAVPSNLFVVGTVNVDESTYMFSPKVLDRAFTLELNEVDLLAMGGLEKASLRGTPLVLTALPESPSSPSKPGPADWVRLCEDHRDVAEAIHGLNELLAGDNRHFGYRVACEIARYVLLAHEQAGEAARDTAVDLAILYKVLPKLNGTQQELEATLDALFAFGVLGAAPSKRDIEMLRDDTGWVIERGRLVRPGKDDVSDEGLAADAEVPARVNKAAYARTAAKLLRMRRRLREQGFTAFIE